MSLDTVKLKKLLIRALPYILIGLVCTNLGEAWRIAEGANASEKLLSFFTTMGIAFGNPLPSPDPTRLESYENAASYRIQHHPSGR